MERRPATRSIFLVTLVMIALWLRHIDGRGTKILLQLREPVKEFPDFVRYIVQLLKTLSPAMSKVNIAETLCRAGLHRGVTTVERILKEEPQFDSGDSAPCTRVVTAKRPQLCLACRPKGRCDIGWLLGAMVAIRSTLLLGDGGGHRPRLSI